MERPTFIAVEIEVDCHTCPVIGTVALTSAHIPELAVVVSTRPRVRVVPPCPPWQTVCNRRREVESCLYNQYTVYLLLTTFDFYFLQAQKNKAVFKQWSAQLKILSTFVDYSSHKISRHVRHDQYCASQKIQHLVSFYFCISFGILPHTNNLNL